MDAQLQSVVSLVVKGLVVMGVTAGVAIAARRRSAATRHAIWTGGLMSLLILPLLSSNLPRLTIPVLPAKPVKPQAAAVPIVETQPLPKVTKPIVRQSPKAPLKSAGSSAVRPSSGSAARQPTAQVDFLAIWVVGVALILGWLAVGQLKAALLVRRASESASDAWRQALLEAQSLLGMNAPVTLKEADIGAPHVVGWRRPTILLPRDSVDLTAQHRRDVLVHELAHIRRSDCLTGFLGFVACALNWPNPLAWVALYRSGIEREHACDDVVLTTGSRPSSYAGELLATAANYRSLGATAGAGMASRRSRLAERLEAILDQTVNRSSLKRRQLLAGLVPCFGVVALIAAAVPGRGEATLNRSPNSDRIALAIDPDTLSGDLSFEEICPPLNVDFQQENPDDPTSARTLNWSGDNCSLVAHAVGNVTFTPDGKDVASLESGSRFELTHVKGTKSRSYVVTEADGALHRQFLENDQEVAATRGRNRWRASAVAAYAGAAGIITPEATAVLESADGAVVVARMIELQKQAVTSDSQAKAVRSAQIRLKKVMAAQDDQSRAKAAEIGQVARAVVSRDGQVATLRTELARTERLMKSDTGGARLDDIKKRIMKIRKQLVAVQEELDRLLEEAMAIEAGVPDEVVGEEEVVGEGEVAITEEAATEAEAEAQRAAEEAAAAEAAANAEAEAAAAAQAEAEAEAQRAAEAAAAEAAAAEASVEVEVAAEAIEPVADSTHPWTVQEDGSVVLEWRATLAMMAEEFPNGFRASCSPGEATGTIYGTGVYTDDSSICTAAVHAGIITLEEGGIFDVEILAGRRSYRGTVRNGIESQPFGEYHRSFRINEPEL